jgi:hypothetical protein
MSWQTLQAWKPPRLLSWIPATLTTTTFLPTMRLETAANWSCRSRTRSPTPTASSIPVRESPDVLAAHASQTRLELASKAGVLDLGVDLAETIKARNSLEKMIAHQVAALHSLVMNAVARANDLTKLHKSFPGHKTYSIEANRNAATAARLVATIADAYVALDRVRRGGRQTIKVIQQVAVGAGGQAVVAGSVKGGGRGKTQVGGGPKNDQWTPCGAASWPRLAQEWQHSGKPRQRSPLWRSHAIGSAMQRPGYAEWSLQDARRPINRPEDRSRLGCCLRLPHETRAQEPCGHSTTPRDQGDPGNTSRANAFAATKGSHVMPIAS